jgi:hypothetical protein
VGLRTEIVTAGQRRVRSYDPSGRLLWEFAGRMTDVSIPTPVAAHDMVYVSSGYVANEHRPAYAVRAGASGDLTVKFGEEPSPFIAWYQPRIASYNPSPLVYGDYYYKLIGKNALDEMSLASPAIAGSRLLIRTASHLYAIR